VDQVSDARRGERTQGGFTLLEVMLALMILAFGMLSLAAMQLYAMRQSSFGRHSGDGATIARSYIEQAARLAWSPALDDAAGDGWVAPGWAGLPSANVTVKRPDGATDTTEKAYTVEWRVTDVGIITPVCLRDIEVRVQWSEAETSLTKEVVLGTRRYNQGDDDC
jgi:type IV pilus assembly protein PilV